MNCAALAAGMASLRATEAAAERRREVAEARELLERGLRNAGAEPYPSEASFVLARVDGDDELIAREAAARGVLVRSGSEIGLPGHIRVTVGPAPLMELAGERARRGDQGHDRMARVLCDSSFPPERVREALALPDVVVEVSAPPWAGDDVVALVSFEPVSAEELEQLPALRVVATPSVGFDHIDVAAATARGVWVCHVPDYCVEEMADHALALLLALTRGIVELDRSVASGAGTTRQQVRCSVCRTCASA